LFRARVPRPRPDGRRPAHPPRARRRAPQPSGPGRRLRQGRRGAAGAARPRVRARRGGHRDREGAARQSAPALLPPGRGPSADQPHGRQQPRGAGPREAAGPRPALGARSARRERGAHRHVEGHRARGGRRGRPLLSQPAPALHDEDVQAVARLATETGLAGVIATNTTIARPDHLRTDRARIERIGAGGLSGPVLSDRSREVLALLRATLPADAAIISCGGVTTAQDDRDRLDAGADLVQGYTAMIYEGPSWPGRIARELAG